MSPSFRVGGGVALALLAAKTVAQTCVSYGVDFQNGGSYFQNISSNNDFTFASIFEGESDMSKSAQQHVLTVPL